MRSHIKVRTLLVALACLLWSGQALAQTGVSSDRVSLPDGAGSLGGNGENGGVIPNTGTMSHSVDFELPSGFEGMTPSVGLSYSSSGGASEAGIGWSMAGSFIERMTSRGLPEYTTADLFAVGGGEELVLVDDGEPAVYRARYEGGFVRYRWFERGAGDEGYWTAEYSDGRTLWFGANSAGQIERDARLTGDEGTFRYHLVEEIDVWGHRIAYSHTLHDGVPTLDTISYAFEGNTPRYRVEINYEARPDFIIDAKPGFEERMTRRVQNVQIFSGGVTLNQYDLIYDDPEDAGGFSRLARVERRGARGGLYPVVHDFEYSSTLQGVCLGERCQEPLLVNMGESLGVDFRTGNVTLVDINGDALPDIVDTSNDGPHRFFINQFRAFDDHTFSAAQPSAVGTGSSHRLSAGKVQVLDVNGDGFSDLLHTGTGQVLENKGEGDWSRAFRFFDNAGDLPDLDAELDDGLDPENGDLAAVRFIDIDNDKRIDVIKSIGAGELNQTQVFTNQGPDGFVVAEGVEPLGLGFDSDRLQLADINGDGLLDPVRLQPGSLRFRLNLGRGRWSAETTIDNLPFDDAEITAGLVELEDINNDGLDDLVVVRSSEISYALNVNGEGFEAPTLLTNEDLDALPLRDNTTTVLYADMNASGSTDIVWISGGGQVTFLDLFPVQPHLLARVTNGLGMETRVTYTTGVEHAAQADANGEAWLYRPTFAVTLVSRIESEETLSGVTEAMSYTYRDGYYDGEEKQFRGFETVLAQRHGDASNDDSFSTQRFDLGLQDTYRAGKLLSKQISGPESLIQTVTFEYGDCPVAEIPEVDQLTYPVRYVCQTALETVAHEGAPESEWPTSRTENIYDGYGNLTRTSNLGVISIGGGGCEPCEQGAEIFGKPCGPQCLGDETHQSIEYIPPSEETTAGRWILGKPTFLRSFGRDGGLTSQMTFYYDGEPFEGLPLGQLTQGAVSRTMGRASEGEPEVAVERFRYNEHGMVVELINPNGSLDTPSNNRERVTYDAMGLSPIKIEGLLHDENGDPYSLQRETLFDELWNKPSNTGGWITVRDGSAVTPNYTETALYDEFGRLEEFYSASDPRDRPSEVLTYDFGTPVSRIIAESSSEVGGALDLKTIRCLDGAGRPFQTRTRIEAGRWQVAGFRVFNSNGSPRRVYARYEGTSEDCDLNPPEGVPYEEMRYDALGRVTRHARIDASGNEVSFKRMEYGPTYTIGFDEEDTNPDSPHFDTPIRHDFNGQGQRWRLTQALNGEDHVYHFTYDELSRFRSWIDPQGNEKIQTYDLRGLVVRVDAPDSGISTFEYDPSGNVVRRVDARGAEMVFEYDGAQRPVASYDPSDPEATRTNYRYDFTRQCPDELCTNPSQHLVEVDFPVGDERGQKWFGASPKGERTFHGLILRGEQFNATWEVNNQRRVVRRTFPDGQSIAFNHDGAMRLSGIEGTVDEIVQGGHGLVEQMRFANGTVTEMALDGRNRLVGQEVRGSSGTFLSVGYQYDEAGNLKAVEDRQPVSGQPSLSAVFTHDALYRLTSAHLDQGNGAFDELMAYEYDTINNLTSKVSSLMDASPAHVGAMTYGGGGAGPHAVTRAGEVAYGYDASGNLTQRGAQTLSWDAQGRLARIADDEGLDTEILYGSGEDRILKEGRDETVWYAAPGFEIRDGVSMLRVDVGGTQIATIHSLALATKVLSDIAPVVSQGDGLASDPDGEINAGDAWIATGAVDAQPSEAPSEVGALLRAATARLLTEEGSRIYHHVDHQNNTLATTDDAGQIIERTTHYPYGMVRSQGAATNFNYTGKELDSTGLIHFGSRLLDPWTGRWTSTDPAFWFHDEENLLYPEEETSAYGFARNNPTTLRDMDGNFALALTSGVTIGIAVAGAVLGSHAYNLASDAETTNSRLMGSKNFYRKPGFSRLVLSVAAAVRGFSTLGISALYSYAKYKSESWARNRAIEAGYTAQTSITIGRAASLATSTTLSTIAAVTIGLLGLSGVGLPVALGIVAGAAVLKAIHIGLKHFNVYRRVGLAITTPFHKFFRTKGRWTKKLQRGLARNQKFGVQRYPGADVASFESKAKAQQGITPVDGFLFGFSRSPGATRAKNRINKARKAGRR